MRILIAGDVVGKPGRDLLLSELPRLRESLKAHFVIANAENAAGGLGITRDIAVDILERGRADVITLGNHAWSKREVHGYLDDERRILRPANYPPAAPGHGFGLFPSPRGPVGVIVLQGRIFMESADDPFRAATALIDELKASTQAVIVEIHAEATSEKVALGRFLDGKASAVIGTHTHVQTADECILPLGTAYQTDVGMTGPTDSVIGMTVRGVLSRFTTGVPTRYEVADGPAHLCGVVVDLDDTTGRAVRVERLCVGPGRAITHRGAEQ